MPKFVAFLRAINVGGHLVKMDQLRALFEELRFSNVETFIASGNVIFDSKTTNTKTLESKIEKHLHNALGYEVTAFVRTTTELTAIAAHKPFSEEELQTEGNTLFIVFVAEKPAKSVVEKLESLGSEIDVFHVHEREIYWLYRSNQGEMKYYGGLLEKNVGMQATVRNGNTIRRLVTKYCKK